MSATFRLCPPGEKKQPADSVKGACLPPGGQLMERQRLQKTAKLISSLSLLISMVESRDIPQMPFSSSPGGETVSLPEPDFISFLCVTTKSVFLRKEKERVQENTNGGFISIRLKVT